MEVLCEGSNYHEANQLAEQNYRIFDQWCSNVLSEVILRMSSVRKHEEGREFTLSH